MREQSAGVWGLLILISVIALLGVMALAGIVVLQRSRAVRLEQVAVEQMHQAEMQALEAQRAAQEAVPSAVTTIDDSAADQVPIDRLEAAELAAEREHQRAEDLQAELDKVKAELAAEQGKP